MRLPTDLGTCYVVITKLEMALEKSEKEVEELKKIVFSYADIVTKLTGLKGNIQAMPVNHMFRKRQLRKLNKTNLRGL